MNYYFASVGLLNSICAFAAGLYVYSKSRSNLTHVSFFYFALSTSLWSGAYSVWQVQTTYEGAIFWMRLTMLPCFYIIFAFLWFCLNLIRSRFAHSAGILAFILPTFFAGFTFSNYIIPTVSRKLYFRFWPDPGILIHLYAVLFVLILILSFSLLFHQIGLSKGREKTQLKWLTYTCLSAWVGGATNWFLWYDIPVPPFLNLFVGIFFFFMTFLFLRGSVPGFEDMAFAAHQDKLRTLGVLAASINHEIKNPVYVMKALAENHLLKLNRQTLDAEDLRNHSQKLAEQVYAQASRTFEIIERLSGFLKSGADLKVRIGPVDFSKALGHVAALLDHQMAVNQIDFVTEISPGLKPVDGDERILEQILFNLLVNAFQVLKDKDGERRISVKAYPVNRQTVIEVCDSAGGLDKADLQQIFKPFYTTKEKGTGLGLYITKKLTEKIGGRISVFSSDAETTFKLELQTA